MQNKKIAVTGGIGSGKSTACKFIEEAGFRVYSCDRIYGALLRDEGFVKKLKNAFPRAIVGGQFDKKKLAEIVFSDKRELERLDKLAFPEIMSRAFELLGGTGVGFLEVPLLFEGGYEKSFDEVWVVTRPRAERIAAVMERSALSKEETVARINSQFDYDAADLSAYRVIENDGGLENLRRKVLKAVEEI